MKQHHGLSGRRSVPPHPGGTPGQPGPACPPRLTEGAFLPGWASRTPCSLKRKKGDHPPRGSPHTSSNSISFMAQVIHKHCGASALGNVFNWGVRGAQRVPAENSYNEVVGAEKRPRSRPIPTEPGWPVAGDGDGDSKEGTGPVGPPWLAGSVSSSSGPPTARPARGHLRGPVSNPSETGRPGHSPPEQEQL